MPSNTPRSGQDAAKRKQQFLGKIRRCKFIDREYKIAELIFANLNSVSGYEIAWPSEETLASISGKNVRTVRHHVACLEALGVIKIRRMGGAEFRDWARETYGISVKGTTTRHYMNIYSPCWDSPLATTGQPADEQVRQLHRLKSARRSGASRETLNTGTSGTLNTGTSGTLNTGTGALLSGRGKRAAGAPFPGDFEDSNLGIPPSAADQTDKSHSGGGNMTTQLKGNQRPMPTANPAEFLEFLEGWETLAQSLPTWQSMTRAGQEKWAKEWDQFEALREGFNLVLDAASPHFSPYCFGDQSLAALTTLSSSIVSSVALTGEMPLFSPV